MMENNGRGFIGMFIPAEIWLHQDLNITEKCLIAEIVSLNKYADGCFASNAHFSKILNLSKNRVSTILNKLQEKGWIKLTNTWSGKQIVKREIDITFNYGPTGMPEPKRNNTDSTDDEGIPNMEGGIPYTEEGTPNPDRHIPNTEEGIPDIRKVNNHLNNHLNNQLNNHNNKQDAEEAIYKPEAFRFYEENGFGTLSSVVIDSITEWMKDFEELGATKTESDDLIKKALKIAAFASNRRWNFVNGVLKNWYKDGLYTSNMVDAAEEERKAKLQQQSKGSNYTRTETMPAWADEENKGEEIDLEKDAEFKARLERIRNRGKEGVQ